MKKIAFATVLALAAASASALEIGVTATRDYSSDARNGGGVTLGQSYGKLNVTAGYDRFTKGSNDQNRFSLVGGYDIAKLGQVTFTPKLGVAYLDNQTSSNGYAMTVGLGASVPVTQKVSVGLDYAYQRGQDRVRDSNGNTIAVGVKYAF